MRRNYTYMIRKNQVEIKYEGDLAPINQKHCNRRFTLSKRYREAKDAIGWAAKKAMHGALPLKGKLRMGISFSYPKTMDIDSPIKCILDACQGIVYDNDSQICVLHIEKHKGPYGAVIYVWEGLVD